MSLNRIQKLLFSEYSDFEDMVLVESPFAETTRDGRGIRQVQIGLTPTKLVLATDIIRRATEYSVYFYPGRVDAEIECLELVSIFPIELVTLSVFRRRQRKVLKAKFHDGNPNHNAKVVYFELGGSDKRKMFWNLWCERVKFLSPEDRGGSSLTETSVGSSTSNSSIYVVKSRVLDERIWQYYAGGDAGISSPKWTEKNLFFGDKMEQISYSAQPIPLSMLLDNDADEVRTLYRRKTYFNSKSSTSSHLSKSTVNSNNRKAEHINRFGEGIEEGCNTGLYLPAISYSKCSLSVQSLDSITMLPKIREILKDFKTLCEEGVEIWERRKLEKKLKHPRRYGLCAFPDFYAGLGIYPITSGDASHVKLKRAISVVNLKQTTATESELKVESIIKSSCSFESLHPLVKNENILRFWTTNYWFYPTTTGKKYKKTLTYLKDVRNFFSEKYNKYADGKQETRIWRRKYFTRKDEKNKFCELLEIKRVLNYDRPSSIWDFDSSTLAYQLTMIDSSLFLSIRREELRMIIKQNATENSVNLLSWLVFSHRCSCLVATEVLKVSDLKLRSRLICRFINTAEKCHRLHNFQSCRSVLTGLQSPAVFRLKETWTRIRQSHATRYQMFEKLCRLYRDPCHLCYQKSFYRATQQPPFLPSASHLFSILLGYSKEIPENKLNMQSQELKIETNQKDIFLNTKQTFKNSLPTILKQFLSAFKIYNLSPEKSSVQTETETNSSDSQGILIHIEGRSEEEIVGSLRNFFEPLTDEKTAHLFESEELLRISQKAAEQYALTEDKVARDYLLKASYQEHIFNYVTSCEIESQKS